MQALTDAGGTEAHVSCLVSMKLLHARVLGRHHLREREQLRGGEETVSLERVRVSQDTR